MKSTPITRTASNRMRSRGVSVVLAVTALLTFAITPVSAGRIDPPGRHVNACIHPSGVNFNELFGVADQFWNAICPNNLSVGEHWRPTAAWTFSEAADAIYPADYTPLRENPIDDWLAKVVAIKMVIDAGTSREKTYLFSTAEAVRTDLRISQVNPSFPAWPTAFLLPRMAPLSPGQHTQQMFVVLSARQCDGLSLDGCAPAGEEPVTELATDVKTPEIDHR